MQSFTPKISLPSLRAETRVRPKAGFPAIWVGGGVVIIHAAPVIVTTCHGSFGSVLCPLTPCFLKRDLFEPPGACRHHRAGWLSVVVHFKKVLVKMSCQSSPAPPPLLKTTIIIKIIPRITMKITMIALQRHKKVELRF